MPDGSPEYNQQTQISAVTSKKMTFIDKTISSDIPSGVLERVSIFSATSTIGRIKNFAASFPAFASTSGDKLLILDMKLDVNKGLGVVRMQGPTGNVFTVSESQPVGHSSARPNDFSAFGNALRNVVFDDVIGLDIVFWNNSNAATGVLSKRIVIFYEEEVVKK
jgi:hypothetical protein